MSDNSLCFRAVTIRRLYGADHDIVIGELCKGVNIVFGANAAGKSTLALVMGGVLWPSTCYEHNPIITAQFEYGGSAWNAVLEGSQSRYQRDGAASAPPPVPPSDQHSRYHLSLQDLLGAIDGHSDFAAKIIEEMAGGINVEKAAEALDFEIKPLRANKRTSEARSARKDWKDAQSEQKRLNVKRRSLDDLRARKKQAEHAALRAAAFDKALQVDAARQAYDEAERAVESFPERMHAVYPEDKAHLNKHETQIEQAEVEKRQGEEDAARAKQEIEATFLPEDGLPDGLLAMLRKRIDKLHELESSREATGTESVRAKKEEEKAWASLQIVRDKDEVDALDLPALNDLEQVFHPVARLRAELRSRDRLRELMGSDGEGGKLDDLRKGLNELNRWLQESDGGVNEQKFRPFVIIGVLSFIVAIAIAVQSAGLLLMLSGALVVLSVALMFIAWRGTASSNQTSERATRQRDFERLELNSPVEWTPEKVRKRSNELLEQWRAAALAEEKQDAWQRWDKEWKDIEAELSNAVAALADYAERLGLDHEALSENGVFWFVKRLADWQHAHEGVAGLASKQEAIGRGIDKCVDAINDVLATYGMDAIESSPAATGAYGKLEEAQHNLEKAREREKQAHKSIERAERAAKEATKSRSELLQRIGVSEEEKREVAAMCDQLGDFHKAVKLRDDCLRTLETKGDDLRELPGFEPEMDGMAESELQEQLEAVREEADEHEGIVEGIAKIEQDIGRAEEGHEVEASRARYEDALETLARDREREYEKVVGRVLADFVQEASHQLAKSPVYERAKDIFSEITKGRYALSLGTDTSFRAIDSDDGIGRKLSELSSGTKIQLLFAVRVAFIEEAEAGCKLPLILDETLATSDDDRTPVIIDAIQTIAAGGRQIIYLTAQSDEVRKWRHAFDGKQDAFEVFPIKESALRDALPVNGELVLLPRAAVPEVEDIAGMSHEEYGSLISVPKWTPRQYIGRLHLWYILEDVPTLHHLLKEGITTWGSLKNLHGAGHVSDDVFHRLKAFGKVVEAWGETWHIGRGKPVDRIVLEAADGLTKGKIDEVAAVCKQVDGDAAELIRKLRGGAVDRYVSQIDKLEPWLLDNGYIDPSRKLTREEMWAQVRVAVADEVARNVLSIDDVERLFDRLG